jgi:aminoglycoside phosphotransferase (APT) family kinase protein
MSGYLAFMRTTVLAFRPDVLLDLLPAGVDRFFSHEQELAALVRRGGTQVDDEGDVELASSVASLTGAAPAAVVIVDPPVRVRQVVRALRRHGYRSIHVRRWWSGMVIGSNVARPPRHVLVGATAVVGHRVEAESALAAVLSAAAAAAPEALAVERVVVRSSGLIAVGARSVLRVALGRTATLHERHVETLRSVHGGAGNGVEAVAPAILAAGTVGSAAWSLEQRMAGRPPAKVRPTAVTMAECIDLLSALHAHTRGATARRAADVAAEAVLAAQTPWIPEAIVDAARAADDRLAGLAGGVGHGDFWSGNLLVDGDRLTGIVDWAAGALDVRPFVDLLHLLITSHRTSRRASLGEAVAHWLRRGSPEEVMRPPLERYARAVGLDADAQRLSALVLAYWVEQVRRHVGQYAGLFELDDWGRRNVLPVLEALR